MAAARAALEIVGLALSVLLIVIGGGLTNDPFVLMMWAAGLSLSLTLATLTASWRRPGRAPIG